MTIYSIMELNDRDQSLIKKYLFSRLTQPEETEFSSRMVNDQDFRTEVEFHRDLFASMRDREHDRLKKKLSDLENKHFSKPSKPNYTRWLLLIVLAMLAVWLLWRFVIAPPTPDAKRVFAAYFSPFENTVEIATRGQNSPASSAAWKAYDSGDYMRAAELFDQLPNEEQSEATRFFQANALLYTGKAREALILLEAKTSKAQFEEQRLWYAALAYVYLGDDEQAKKRLVAIKSNPGHFKFQEAGELFHQLE
ncbi:MAG TPA: hypothetical protein PLC89_14925 [Haliscomenobacter sp.]|uniref:tetratricopeptide repeat protein n=1 Tax=Haliscomenobacter sp. TaxID=2717303 RepID=UPI002C3618DD|nr:hypothetical protein [Haliscomenobacter sp.]HOY18597.1 hypothetical protein [Haliscomenobacter sp.]HPH19289.1 hypothetical protein [Haliscomenobacter sp.]